MEIQNLFSKIPDAQAKKILTEIFVYYTNPSFGSQNKREFDIFLFMKLQDLGILKENAELFEIITLLKITRTKARNLLYEAHLRRGGNSNPDLDLIAYFVNPIILKEDDKVGIEIQNPFLVDHLKAKMKKLGYITDGSFSPEITKMTTTAFVAVFENLLPMESLDRIHQALIEAGLKSDTSIKGILKAWLKKIGEKMADDAGAKVAENLSDYLGVLVNGSIEKIKQLF